MFGQFFFACLSISRFNRSTLNISPIIFLVRSAFALAHAHCALGAFYRRVRAKHGGPAAITATAHKLARIIYKMLRDKVEYVDLGPDYYDEKYKSRIIHSLKNRAESLGYQLIPISTQ